MKNKTLCSLNFCWAANYGAIITAYALNEIIKNNNYNVININNGDDRQLMIENKFKFGRYFLQKYFDRVYKINDKKDLLNLNNLSNIFVVGSDQVFRPNINNNIYNDFLLNYVNKKKKKIAFSASFGVDKEQFLKENSDQTIKYIKNSLKSFDFISVREKSGLEICRDLFDIQAEWIIDPVFILNKSKYCELIKNSSKDFSGNIVSYLFEKQNHKIYSYLRKKYKKNVVELWHSNLSIENWLNAIKNCEFLVTNSYHAMCFAIIFNKPFIALSKDTGASTRFDSLYEMLDIKDQSVSNIDEIYERDCIFKIDYNHVNHRIKEERQRGLEFLKNVLAARTKITQEKIDARIMYLENTVCELEQQATLKYQIKKELWQLWLIIFHKYLPKPMRNIIRAVRDRKCK